MRKLKQEIPTDRSLFCLERKKTTFLLANTITSDLSTILMKRIPVPDYFLLLLTSVRAQTVFKTRTVRKAALGHLMNQYFMEQFTEAGLCGLPPLKR